MNILSFCAAAIAVLYCVLLSKRFPSAKGDRLVQFSLAVFACLGWWAFCDAFFYSAATQAEAQLWMHLGSLGWSGFIPVTAYYLMIMCGDNKRFGTLPRQILYWAPAAALTALFMMPGNGVLADSLVPSGSGLGWAYRQSFTTLWPYLILLELAVYLGTALVRLYIWQRHVEGDAVRTLSKGFIILDVLAVSVGFVLIFVLPQLSSYLPPLSFIAILIFMIGYWIELRGHDLQHIELALDPTSLFENSLDAVLITDVQWRILYANAEAKRILGCDDPRDMAVQDILTHDGASSLGEFAASGKNRLNGISLTLTKGSSLLCSISRTTTRRRGHEVFIFSLHDASSLKNAQERLEYLAHNDELTGLPNRRMLGELLDRWEERYVQPGGDFSVLFLDLNRFKRINDLFGHNAGDSALRAAAGALAACVPEGDVVTRLSGDEFIVLHAPGDMSVQDLSERIHQAVKSIDCSLFAAGVHLDVSIGYCMYSEAGSVHRLIKLADERMYDSKNKMHEVS